LENRAIHTSAREAKLLAESGRTDALAKFEAAFSVIPDSDVGRQIAQLKEDIPAAAQKVE
jgi:hypothetical protein